MTNKAPAFQFYPKDWLSDKKVCRLTYEEKGIYFELLCHMWNDSKDQCSIEDDFEVLRNILRLTKKKFEKISKNFMKPGFELFKREGDFLISKRLKRERKKQEELSIKRKEAANKRWKKEECNSNANDLQLECPPSSSSSSTPNKDNNIYIEFAKLWNETITNKDIPKVANPNKLSQKRKQKIKERLKYNNDFEYWKAIFKKLQTLKFYCGDNNRGWVASFNYIIRNDDNHVTILEQPSPQKKMPQVVT